MLEIKNVNVTFHGKHKTIEAVRHVSLNIKRGEIFGIIGTSGAGKSTLLRTINLLEKPDSGEILVDGQNIANCNGSALRAVRLKIGMVFQHFNLAHSRTVFDNIALPLRAAGVSESVIKNRVAELLALVELQDRGQAFPAQLSGGQKQRVGIARAIANNPGILLCDEPTSALDLETTESILELIADINRRLGVTVVIISHEMSVIKKICHRVAVMQNGEVVEENDVYSLFSAPVHAFSRELVHQSLDITIPRRLLEKTDGALLRLLYLGEKAEEPVLSDAIREYPITITIVHGKIEYIQEHAIGVLFVAVHGEKQQVRNALAYLGRRVAGLEVVRYE